ncbi:twin-arginine translocase TatA/TatE family subunit [Pedobacter sp.]|uniref:Sec-independent protein translocase subunit TatA/TatB n=1 Tax=Pedobacter sp. TaxID=1411316 RepID=UPI00396C63E8
MYSATLLEFLNIGGSEMMLIVLAILLLFGGKKLPELARGLGKGIREFKDASEGVKREIHRNINSFDADVDNKSTAADHTYREPETDQGYSIHDKETPLTDSATEANGTQKEDKEPTSSY